MAHLSIRDNDVTLVSKDSSEDPWSPDTPTRPLTSDFNASPPAAPRQNTPYTPDYAFPFLEAAAAAQAGSSSASGTPRFAGAPSGEGILNYATEAVPSHGESALNYATEAAPSHGESMLNSATEYVPSHGESAPSPFQHEQRPSLPPNEQQSPFSHPGHEQQSPFSHSPHEQSPFVHSPNEQQSPFSHSPHEQAYSPFGSQNSAAAGQENIAHQQPHMGHAAHQQPFGFHASHQQPFTFRAAHQQPHVISHGGKSTRGFRPSLMTIAATSAAVVAIITAALLVLYLNRAPTAAASSPALAINGSAIPGQTIVIQGSHFAPDSTVSVTLDDQPLSSGALPATMTILQLAGGSLLPLPGTPVRISSNGTFSISIQVNSQWDVGSTHTVRVYDQSGKFVLGKDFIVISDTTPRITSCSASTSTPTLSLGPLTQGQTQPVTASFSLCTSGTGQVNWTSAWDHNQAPWLQLDHTSGQTQAPQTQQVIMSASAGNLPPGTYTATVTFSSDTAQVSVEVSLVIQPQATPTPTAAAIAPPPTATPTTAPAPCIQASPQSLTFASQQGQADPAAQNVTITNCGSIAGNWSAMTTTQSGGNWLSTSSSNGSLNASANQAVSVKVSNKNMTIGTYQGTVTVSMGSQTATVAVTLNVSAQPNPVCVKPASTTLTFAAAHQTAPAAQTLKLSNACDAGNWTASADANWITLNPASGSIAANGSANVSVGVTITNLTAGAHSGTITFSSGTTTSKVTVNLTVQAPTPCISLTQPSLTFNETAPAPVLTSVHPAVSDATSFLPAADPGSDSQVVSIKNPDTCDAGAWSASSDSSSWLTVSPASGQIASNGGTSVTITVTYSNLAPNTYTGHITFTAGTSSATLTVTLNLQSQQACIQADPGQLLMSPADTRTVTITNCGAPGSLAFSSSKTWLNVSANNTSNQLDAGGKGSFTITVTTSDYDTGTITYTITTSAGTTSTAQVTVEANAPG